MPHMNAKRWLIVACVVMGLLSILPSGITGTVHGWGSRVVDTTTSPITSVIRDVSLMIRPGEHRGTDKQLPIEQQLEDYTKAVIYARQLEAEVTRLREKLEFYEQTSEVLGAVRRRFVDARVTRFANDDQKPTLVLAKGHRSGIDAGQAAVSGVHLVGLVSETVGPLTSRVDLVMKPGEKIQALIRPHISDPQTRQITKTLELTKDGQYWATSEVWIGEEVEVGDVAHLSDSLWPSDAQGFLIGQVVEIDNQVERPLEFKRLLIEPGVDATRLRSVTVLVEDRGPVGGDGP